MQIFLLLKLNEQIILLGQVTPERSKIDHFEINFRKLSLLCDQKILIMILLSGFLPDIDPSARKGLPIRVSVMPATED